MSRRRRASARGALALCTALLGPLALAFAAPAAAGDCGQSGLVCTTVEVPVDRGGVVPGTIPLHVEMLPAAGTPVGVVFLLAGGPGQGSTETFALGSQLGRTIYRFLFPGYTLVAYDDRGTGRSAPLGCEAVEQATAGADPAQVAAACADELGPQATFYRTVDNAADLDALRQALGFDRIALMGVSYGTRQALAYASAYPDHVSRLVLDSVVAPDEDVAFSSDVMRALPATLERFCAGGRCAAATPDFAGDVAAVANAFAASAAPQPVSALEFLGLVVGADLNPGVAAELPAVVHAARSGDRRPLEHLLRVAGAGEAPLDASVNGISYLAAVCDDVAFPWQREADLPDREASLQSALAAFPAGTFGPFGTWAAGLGPADACAGWPASGGAQPPPAPLPDVPALVFSGGFDMRTPTSGAAEVVAQLPQGHLVVVPGVGHSVLTSDASLCSQRALRAWLASSRVPPAACPRQKAWIDVVPAFPRAGTARLDAKRSLAAARTTVREAEAEWLASAGTSGKRATVHGPYSGSLAAAPRSFDLRSYSIDPGVTVSGKVTVTALGVPLSFTGSLRIGGARAVHGALLLTGGAIRGTLAGRTRTSP